MRLKKLFIAAFLVSAAAVQPNLAVAQSGSQQDADFDRCVNNPGGFTDNNALWDYCYRVVYGTDDEPNGIVRDPGGIPNHYPINQPGYDCYGGAPTGCDAR